MPYATESATVNEMPAVTRKAKQLQDRATAFDHPIGLASPFSPAYQTEFGAAFQADALDILRSLPDQSVNAVITSPPYALHFKKEYALPEFFIKMLTREGDIILDPFAGSNTTGRVAEDLRRRWISCDNNTEYVAASAIRFGMDPTELGR